MLLKKEYLKKFIDKINERSDCSYHEEGKYAEIKIDELTIAKAVIRDASPDFSVECGSDGPYTNDENADLGKAIDKCKSIVEGIIKEIEDEGC